VYNEVQSIPKLHAWLLRMSAGDPVHSWEFVFVDDGSGDGTWEALLSAKRIDARVRAIRFARNFGQTAAMACGIQAARGRTIVTMDGDLQNDPADIPKLLAKLNEGFDVVCGWRYARQDKLWSRKVPSRIANWMIRRLTGVTIHDYGCSLKAYRAEAIKRTPLYAEFHRFIPALSTLTGALISEEKVTHHARAFGKTKYTISRTWRVALDMITVSLLVKFASKPLRFFGMLALGSAVAALACLSRASLWYEGPFELVPQVLPAIGVLGLWLAGHLVVIGWIAELCLATAHQRPERMLAPQEQG
jgi:glycosyltransferase involved in cell wall biosynthesis